VGTRVNKRGRGGTTHAWVSFEEGDEVVRGETSAGEGMREQRGKSMKGDVRERETMSTEDDAREGNDGDAWGRGGGWVNEEHKPMEEQRR
jgi:hypothetical protein